MSLMNPLASFTMLITTAQSLVAAVTTRDNLHIRPAFARKSVAARLRSGMIVLRAFLRRLIILIALDMEWHLVDNRGPMKRPHGRKSISLSKLNLKLLDDMRVSPWLNAVGPSFKPVIKTGRMPPVDIGMSQLYAQLDFLAGIAADPSAKAKRFAFHLARTYEGIIMAPAGPKRIAGLWGTQVSAFYDVMAHSIITKSRDRPPPLDPPRTHWPTITAL
jgi:hypothetical protein